MKSIKVTVLGKEYPLKIDESEEETMLRIAQYVDQKLRQYKRELHKQPDSTVMVLAALSIAEELFEERRRNRKLSEKEDGMMGDVNNSVEQLLEKIRT